MRYYDEVLTQSARNYAFTQDKKWENRYRTIEPESDKMIKESISICSDEDRKVFETLGRANQALVSMEYRAIDLVNNGKANVAICLLESDEYKKQKKILSGGLANYVLSHDMVKNIDEIIHTPSFQTILDLEKRLAVYEANLKNEKMAIVGERVSRISHDLRNPVSVIKNTVDIIKMKNQRIDKDIEKDLLRIERAVTNMTHQIDYILDYIKPQNLEHNESSLRHILLSTLDRTFLPNTVKINLPKNDEILTCDPKKLVVVFSNMITNAMQSMNYNGSIDIRIIGKDSDVEIEIEDTGTGISADVLPHIFEPLYTTKTSGTGLGLSTCKSIVEKHNGTIYVKTKIGKGTTFIIKLPRLKKS